MGDDERRPMKRFMRLRADSALWLGSALVLFVVSGVMTLVITHVDRHPQQDGIELAFDIAPAAQTAVSQIAPPNVQITSNGDNLRLGVLAIDANTVTTVKFGPVLSRRLTCNAYGGVRSSSTAIRPAFIRRIRSRRDSGPRLIRRTWSRT